VWAGLEHAAFETTHVGGAATRGGPSTPPAYARKPTRRRNHAPHDGPPANGKHGGASVQVLYPGAPRHYHPVGMSRLRSRRSGDVRFEPVPRSTGATLADRSAEPVCADARRSHSRRRLRRRGRGLNAWWGRVGDAAPPCESRGGAAKGRRRTLAAMYIVVSPLPACACVVRRKEHAPRVVPEDRRGFGEKATSRALRRTLSLGGRAEAVVPPTARAGARGREKSTLSVRLAAITPVNTREDHEGLSRYMYERAAAGERCRSEDELGVVPQLRTAHRPRRVGTAASVRPSPRIVSHGRSSATAESETTVLLMHWGTVVTSTGGDAET
jgi:hypothetical protein